MSINRTISILSVATILMQTSLSLGAWNHPSLQWAQAFNTEKIRFADPDVMTVWGGFKSGHVALYKSVKKNVFDVRLKSKKFKTGGVVAKYYAQKSASGKIATAPLVVFLPGIFDGFSDNAGMRAFYKYSIRGYHVLGIPNPWSVPYLSETPSNEPSNIAVEAQVVLELIESFKSFMGEGAITNIELVGESYGGLLSTAVFATDSVRAQRLVSGPVTIFSPPLDLVSASKALDGLLENTAGIIHGPCAIVRKGATIVYDLYRRDTETEMSMPTRNCARSVLAQSFSDKLANATITYEAAHGLNGVPNRMQHPVLYEEWHKQLRFETFVNRYLKNQDFASNAQAAVLGYWINSTPEALRNQFRIMTAHDDLLNLPESWQVIESVLPIDSIIVLPWGGHIGFEALPEFDHLLDASFGPPGHHLTK